MVKKLYWKCPNCGARVDFEDQITEDGVLFDPESGEATYYDDDDFTYDVWDYPIKCKECGSYCYFNIDPMILPKGPKRSIQDIKKESQNNVAEICDWCEINVIYRIRSDIKSFLREELLFSCFTCIIWEEDENSFCRTNCPEDNFRRIYARAACEKETVEGEWVYITREERMNPYVRNFLKKRFHKKYCILPEEEITDFAVVSGEETIKKRIDSFWYEVSGDPPHASAGAGYPRI